MKISVLGCGRWGSFIAWYLCNKGYDVYSWGPEGDYSYEVLKTTGKNEYVTLDKRIHLTCDLEEAVKHAEVIIISISSQGLRGFVKRILAYDVSEKDFVLCMKGIEVSTGSRLSEVLTESGISPEHIAVWVGPGHIQAFTQGIPNCMVIAAREMKLTRELVDAFSSPLIRFYYGEDLLGTEIGAASKNVIGLAAGMLDGFGYSSLKGALMARGTHELSRLIEAMGGDRMTVYGLSHLGDYEATLFSPHSNNRRFGEDLITGKPFAKLAEGVYTVEALMDLSREFHVELPICATVYAIIHDHKDPKEQLMQLFMRATKSE